MFQFIKATISKKHIHKQVLILALPMVLSNITVPLLGLVDTAVIGHLEHEWYLGGVALGSIMISVSFWLFGFLRMSTTGLTAQALGRNDKTHLAIIFLQGVMTALLFALVFLFLHDWIATQVFSFSSASAEVKHYGLEYFSVRIWSAPAALMNYVLFGWLLGMQNAKAPMWIVIIANITNIALDVFFVIGLGMKVEGAALASVIADYTGLAVGLCFVSRAWRINHIIALKTLVKDQLSQLTQGLGRFFMLNRDIFLRSLCLQAAFSFMTFRGAAYGDDIVAANAVLMSFLMMISYGMDGFAYAMEAMVGKAIGSKDNEQLTDSVVGTFFWSLVICALLTLGFGIFGANLISMITDIPVVQEKAAHYLPWLVAMPLIAMWCFLFDGIFIGATKGKEMRNSMFIATCSFFVVFWFSRSWENHALWAAMIMFMLMRGLTLGYTLYRQWRAGSFI